MAVDKVAMARMGFKSADRAIKRRIIVNATAPEFSGKTNFMLTAPSPIGVFNFDNGLEGVVNKFPDKEVYVTDLFDANPLSVVNQKSAQLKMTTFEKNYVGILNERTVRSVGVDTETELWEVARLAEFGKLSGNLPRYYEEVNKRMDRLAQLAYASDKNLIFLSKVKDEYVANSEKKEVRTGKRIFAGYKNIPYLVQVDLMLGHNEEGFSATILKCRQNPDIIGLTIFNEDVNFQTIGTLVFPDTTIGDWQ